MDYIVSDYSTKLNLGTGEVFKLATLKKSSGSEAQLYREPKESKFRKRIKRFTFSTCFQSILTIFIIIYISLTAVEMILEIINYDVINPKKYRIIARYIGIINTSIMLVCFIDHLLRAFINTKGFYIYFLEPINAFDFLSIIASGVIEALSIFTDIILPHTVAIIISVRLIWSLRSLAKLQAVFIEMEISLLKSSERKIKKLTNEFNVISKEGIKTKQELSEVEEQIKKCKAAHEAIGDEMLKVESQSWISLVPVTLAVSCRSTKSASSSIKSNQSSVYLPADDFLSNIDSDDTTS